MHLKAVSPLHHIHLVNILFACTPTPLDGPFGPEENWWVGRISLSVEYSVLWGPVPRKVVKFNPELNWILSKVFLSKDMQLERTTYYWAFTLRYGNGNTKCYLKQYIGR